MNWIKCVEELPEHTGPTTFYGGIPSAVVIGLWTNGEQPQVRQCLHIDYREANYNSDDCDPDDGWMDVDEDGSCDRCTSHGGHAPTHWMPMPPIPERVPVANPSDQRAGGSQP
jgi:hypothetical protein